MEKKELIALREQINDATDALNNALCDAYESCGKLRELVEKADAAEQEMSKLEFNAWLKIGIRIGAEVEVDGCKFQKPLIVTGICGEGFILTDASGKEFTLFARYLKQIERFHVVPHAGA